jgi:hypothetical protein
LIKAVQKSDRSSRNGKPVYGRSKAPVTTNPATPKPVKRSNSVKTSSKLANGSKTLPRSHSVREKAGVKKAGSSTENTVQSRSQTLPRPAKKTVPETRSPSRPSNINLTAGPGTRKMGKSGSQQPQNQQCKLHPEQGTSMWMNGKAWWYK